MNNYRSNLLKNNLRVKDFTTRIRPGKKLLVVTT